MQTTEITQAILLLTCLFNKNEARSIKPLTPAEYSRLAKWLHQNKQTPATLLKNPSGVLENWQDEVTKERIESLLARGVSMAFALENWAKFGVKVITRACANYPAKIREKMGENRPPVFFAMGHLELLNPLEAVVIFKATEQAAIQTALEQGRACIALVADSLLPTAANKVYRQGLRSNKLLLLSPFYPEARFTNANTEVAKVCMNALTESL